MFDNYNANYNIHDSEEDEGVEIVSEDVKGKKESVEEEG